MLLCETYCVYSYILVYTVRMGPTCTRIGGWKSFSFPVPFIFPDQVVTMKFSLLAVVAATCAAPAAAEIYLKEQFNDDVSHLSQHWLFTLFR